MAFVSTAEQGLVWALDQVGGLWLIEGEITWEPVIRNEEHGWTLVEPERLVQIDTGFRGHTVARNVDGKSFYREGVVNTNLMGTSWTTFGDEQMSSITMCANRNVFAVGLDGLVRMRGGMDSENRRTPNFDAPYGMSWQAVPNESYNIDQVACGYHGKVWATNPDGQVFRRTEIDADHPAGSAWTYVESDFQAKMIAVGDNGPVWAAAENSDVYRRVGVSEADFEGTAWELVSPNALKQVSVGTYQVWGINVMHEIFRRRGICEDNATGNEWEQSAGQLSEISVGYGPVLWGVDEAHNAWFKQLGEVTTWPDDLDRDEHWIHVPGVLLKQLDFGKDGQVWGMGT